MSSKAHCSSLWTNLESCPLPLMLFTNGSQLRLTNWDSTHKGWQQCQWEKKQNPWITSRSQPKTDTLSFLLTLHWPEPSLREMRAYAPSWWILWKASRKRTVEIYLSFLWASYVLATKFWVRKYEKMWNTTSCLCWSRTYLSMHASWECDGARDTGGVAVLSTLPWHVSSILCTLKCQPYPGMLQVSYAYLQSFKTSLQSFAFPLQSFRTSISV